MGQEELQRLFRQANTLLNSNKLAEALTIYDEPGGCSNFCVTVV
jgi:hypothetical protein